MMVMRSVGGALAGASWILLVFFGATLTAYMAGRVWYALKERREKEAAELKIREDAHREEKALRDAASEKRRAAPAEPTPLRRQEPSEARPVSPRTESKNLPSKRP
ncbi:MAG: hypothetical protein M0D55_17015 [Elusimicrobiota bacterium]|nr:MAG: hypothetical protein M0D55_17015 [Elusimicrobiota bacterium]